MSGWFKLVTHFFMTKAEIIWAVAGATLQVCVVLLMVVRRPYFGQFPTFGVFLMFSVLSTVVALSLQKSKALLRAVFFRPPHDNPANVAFVSLEIAVAFLQFGVFCVFVLLVRFFHMRWQQHAFGIVLGFGIAAAGSLVFFLLRSEFGTILNRLVRTAVPVTYIIGVVIWLATFLRGEPSGTAISGDDSFTPEQMITELRRHTKAVKGILGR